MNIIVKKFGGSSLESLERIEKVADMIVSAFEPDQHVVIVVSAMYSDTDRLISKAKYFSEDPDPREYAQLASTGEIISASLLCMALIAKGYRAKSMTAYQAGIFTDSNYKKAQILHIDVDRIRSGLQQGQIMVITGFQGVDKNGDITTLGRGGSDTTAIALASILKAKECQIYTDVDGVYTADPKVASKAAKLDSINFTEMYELASVGTTVLQTRAVEFCGQYQTPVRVLSSYEQGIGTLIKHDQVELAKPAVHAISYDKNVAKLTIVALPDGANLLATFFEQVVDRGIEIDMLSYIQTIDGAGDVYFTITRDDLPKLLKCIDGLLTNFQAKKVLTESEVVKLSLAGFGLRTSANGRIIKRIFSILKQADIPIQMIALAETKVSMIVDEKYLLKSVNLLHDELGLANTV